MYVHIDDDNISPDQQVDTKFSAMTTKVAEKVISSQTLDVPAFPIQLQSMYRGAQQTRLLHTLTNWLPPTATVAIHKYQLKTNIGYWPGGPLIMYMATTIERFHSSFL